MWRKDAIKLPRSSRFTSFDWERCSDLDKEALARSLRVATSEVSRLLDPKDKEHTACTDAAHQFTEYETAEAVEAISDADELKLIRALFKAVYGYEAVNAEENFDDRVCLRTPFPLLHETIASC